MLRKGLYGHSVCAVTVLLGIGFFSSAVNAKLVNYVIHVSVDGLRPDAITSLGPTNLPNFYRFRTAGAITDNARTDYDYTITLPNHCTQLTGRGVLGTTGHNWTENSDPEPGATLASNKGSYVAGVCDVAHDNGLWTGIYANKSKFSLFDTSWNANNGALDGTPPDNGRDKVDVYYMTTGSEPTVSRLVTDLRTQPCGYAFIHMADLDRVGGWDPTPGSGYSNAVMVIDTRLGVIFDLIDTTPQLAGRTAVILTADHGGTPDGHNNAGVVENYTIPFYIWGPGVTAGANLYALNPGRRLDPGTSRPTYAASVQPIRNGEAANVALKLLGLPAVPGSTINQSQNLAWSTSADPVPSAPVATAATNATNCGFTAHWNSVSGATGYLLDVATNSGFTQYAAGFQNIIVGNVLSFNVTGLDASTAYYYRVSAYNDNGTSGNSNTIIISTTANMTPPSPPAAVAAAAITGSSFAAHWSPGCGATGYRLDVSLSSTFSSYVDGYQNLDVGKVTSWTVSELAGSTTYYYRTRAYNGLGTSGNSNTISATTADINFCVPGVLLGHGDMEDSSSVEYSVCPDWMPYSAGNGAASWAKEKTVVHSGLAAQRTKNINASAGSLIGVYQTIDANVGDAFTFEGWVYPETNPAYAQAAMAVRWDGSTLIPDGTASWKISGGPRLVWTKVQGFSGNATSDHVTLFLDSRQKSGSVSITAYWDDVASYRAYVPPPPTVSVASNTSLNMDVNAGCNTSNTSAEYAVTIGGGAYTLGTHWVQANGSVGTSALWQTDAAWGVTEVTGLTTGTKYTFKTQARHSSTRTQATILGGGSSGTPSSQAPTAPAITQHPSNQSASLGGTATFTVIATGTPPLAYHWQKNQTNLADGGHYSGVSTATLTISNVDGGDASNYRCMVTNSYGSATSDPASLMIASCAEPTYTNGDFEASTAPYPPIGWATYIQSGASGNWTLQTVTPPEGAQWQQTQVYNVGSYGGVRQNITGLVSGAVYTISGSFKTNSASSTASVRYNLNGNTDRTNSTVLASKADTNWGTFSGAVTAAGGTITLFLDHVNGTSTNKASGFDNITITVLTCPSGAPTITQQPAAQNVCAGATVAFGVTATGSGTLAYQWQKNNANISNGGHYSGATTATLTISGTDTNDVANYRCVVSNSGGSVTSNAAALTQKAATAITVQPVAQSICPGSNTLFAVTATGNGTLAYRWQKNGVNVDNGGHYSGCTTATLAIADTDTNDAANYRCIVTGDCGSTTSDQVALTLRPRVAADLDLDCDVDQVDFDLFAACSSGPMVQLNSGCKSSDFDNDNDVDQSDFGIIQRCYSGENVTINSSCAD